MRSGRVRVAVGLKYEPAEGGDHAPSLQVKGEAHLAERIVALARKHGVPVVEDAALARSLAMLSLDDPIPPSLFEAVAVVLTAIDRVHRRGNAPPL